MHSSARVSCASSGSDSVSLEVSGTWGGWGDWRIQMESHSHGAFECSLKYCNYETSAHDRTVVITSQKVGIAECHFAVGTHTHTHTLLQFYNFCSLFLKHKLKR